MGASTVGRQQRVVLAPLRYDMRQVLTPQNTTRASHDGANQINFSAGVTQTIHLHQLLMLSMQLHHRQLLMYKI